MRKVTVFIVSCLLCLENSVPVIAQCSMCRATVVNNVSNGEQLELAASLNLGIIYLFIMPYLLAVVIGFFWYRSAKTAKPV